MKVPQGITVNTGRREYHEGEELPANVSNDLFKDTGKRVIREPIKQEKDD